MFEQLEAACRLKGFHFSITSGGEPQQTRDLSGRKLWYYANLEGTRVSFQYWSASSSKHNVVTTANASDKKTKAEHRAFLRDVARQKQKAHEFARDCVAEQLKEWAATPRPIKHNYLLQKKIPVTGLMFAQAGERNSLSVVVPMSDLDGAIWNIQLISENGDKSFQSGRTEGLVYQWGETGGVTVVAEGWATGFAAHQLLSCCDNLEIKSPTPCRVLTCFSVQNLDRVIKALIEKGERPENIVIAADYDGATYKDTGFNPGIQAAKELTLKYNCKALLPHVGALEKDKNIDFADIFVRGEKIQGGIVDFKDLKDQVLDEVPEARASLTLIKTTSEIQSYANVRRENFPDCSEAGRPKATLANLEALLRLIGATVRYNVIKKDVEWFIPGEAKLIDLHNEVIFARLIDLHERIGMSSTNLKDYLLYIAEQNVFNPVLCFLESKPWDGQRRFDKFLETVVVSEENRILRNTFIKRWMIYAVACAVRPQGTAAAGMLIFQGPQGIGKTSWFKLLLDMDSGLIAEGRPIDPGNKDIVKQICSYWLVEGGEMDGITRKVDVASFKAFLTRVEDELRLPYGRKSVKFPRRTAFFGSVNKKEFLVDDTGNRRFWTVPCLDIHYEHDFDMQQVWAEVFQMFKSGEKWFPTKKEEQLLAESNESFERIDPLMEKLEHEFDWNSTTGVYMSATEAYETLNPGKIPSKDEVNRVAEIIRRLNGNKKPKTAVAGRRGRFLWVGGRRDTCPRLTGKPAIEY